MDFSKIKINIGDGFSDLEINNLVVSKDEPTLMKFDGKEISDKDCYITVRFNVNKDDLNKFFENIKHGDGSLTGQTPEKSGDVGSNPTQIRKEIKEVDEWLSFL